MSYQPARWPKIVLLIPAAAIVILIVGAGLSAQVDRYTNRAATAQARDAIRNCAVAHGVQFAWRQHRTLTAFDTELRYFSARTQEEVAAANCILDKTPEMSIRYKQQVACLDEGAVVEIKRTITGGHYWLPEENYRFVLSPCGNAHLEPET